MVADNQEQNGRPLINLAWLNEFCTKAAMATPGS